MSPIIFGVDSVTRMFHEQLQCMSARLIELIPLQAPSPAGPPVIQYNVAWLVLHYLAYRLLLLYSCSERDHGTKCPGRTILSMHHNASGHNWCKDNKNIVQIDKPK